MLVDSLLNCFANQLFDSQRERQIGLKIGGSLEMPSDPDPVVDELLLYVEGWVADAELPASSFRKDSRVSAGTLFMNS